MFRLNCSAYLLLLALLLASCAAPNQAQLIATAEQIAGTGVARTIEAQPSMTSLPSAMHTPTHQPSATAQFTASVSASSPTPAPQANGTLVNELPTAVSGTQAADKSDSRTALLLQNNTDEIIWLILEGTNYYVEYRFSDSFLILVPQGEYHYRVWMGSKGPIKGSFRIGNQDKHTMFFSPGKVRVEGP